MKRIIIALLVTFCGTISFAQEDLIATYDVSFAGGVSTVTVTIRTASIGVTQQVAAINMSFEYDATGGTYNNDGIAVPAGNAITPEINGSNPGIVSYAYTNFGTGFIVTETPQVLFSFSLTETGDIGSGNLINTASGSQYSESIVVFPPLTGLLTIENPVQVLPLIEVETLAIEKGRSESLEIFNDYLSGQLIVRILNSKVVGDLLIYDIRGVLQEQVPVVPGSTQFTFDTSNYAAGLYIATLDGKSEKFIVN